MLSFHERLLRRLAKRAQRKPACQLGYRQIYVLPTRFGGVLFGVALCILIGAINYKISLAYAFAFWMISLIGLSAWMAQRQLLGLSVKVVLAPPVFLGEKAKVDCLITSHFPLPSRQIFIRPIGGVAEEETFFISLPDHNETIVQLVFPVSQRGYVLLPAYQISSEAPFGLFRAFSLLHFSASVLVYPRLVETALPIKYASGEEEAGMTDQQGADEFSFLTPYQAGDALQKIAWKVFARKEVLSTKQFVDRQGNKMVLLSWQQFLETVDGETRLSILAWQVIECEKRGWPYCLVLPGQTISWQSEQKHKALTALALYEVGKAKA